MTATIATELPKAPAKAGRTRRAAYNHHGQKIGSKGERTRKALIETTVSLLETHGLREVSVMDVARAVGTSPATFYVYFRGVPEVVLAALEGALQTSPEMEALLRRDWLAQGDGIAAARRFVELYTDLWNRNGTIFRVRNLAAEEGDQRFYATRIEASEPVLGLLAEAAAKAQRAGRVPKNLSPRACGSTVLMMLERLSAIGPVTPDRGGTSYAEQKDAAAFTLLTMLGGKA